MKKNKFIGSGQLSDKEIQKLIQAGIIPAGAGVGAGVKYARKLNTEQAGNEIDKILKKNAATKTAYSGGLSGAVAKALKPAKRKTAKQKAREVFKRK